jgi:hypothetical protein
MATSHDEQGSTCINNGITVHNVAIRLLLSDRQEEQLQLFCDF